jgi:integrase
MAHIQTRILADGKTKSYDVTWHVEIDGKRKNPQQSFRRRRDAEDFCRQIAADELEGIITQKPQRRSELFQDFTENWLKTRLVRGKPLAPATLIGYGGLLRRNIYPHFAHTQIRRITAEDIRLWYAEVTASAGADQARKSYRLLHAILATAAEEGVIPSRVNPCQITGAGVEPPNERPLVETSVVLELAEAIDERLQALVYLAGFGGLRTGESLALRRRDIFPAKRTVRVVNQAQEIKGLGRHVSGPKSEAGQANDNAAQDGHGRSGATHGAIHGTGARRHRVHCRTRRSGPAGSVVNRLGGSQGQGRSRPRPPATSS